VPASPLDPHAASPRELQERLHAAASGTALLVYRTPEGGQVLVDLDAAGDRVTIGRGAGGAVSLDWDPRVSRVHAAVERVGGAWTVVDDGLSRNGTLVNGERLHGRRRLRDGDVLAVGDTAIAFAAPGPGAATQATQTSAGTAPGDALTPAQRRVLVALCRPYGASTFATPASNPEIARELTLSVEAVKTTMRTLFDLFGIDDLPQNRKRAALAEQALRTGVIRRSDL
jgi:pSer/pThr/pTyr-binding forkhead associated (FHA) protein